MTARGREDEIDLNGARVRYRIGGEEHGQTLFLLHGGRGFGDHRGEWSAYAP